MTHSKSFILMLSCFLVWSCSDAGSRKPSARGTIAPKKGETGAPGDNCNAEGRNAKGEPCGEADAKPDNKPEGTPPTDTNPADTNPADTNPADTKTTENIAGLSETECKAKGKTWGPFAGQCYADEAARVRGETDKRLEAFPDYIAGAVCWTKGPVGDSYNPMKRPYSSLVNDCNSKETCFGFRRKWEPHVAGDASNAYNRKRYDESATDEAKPLDSQISSECEPNGDWRTYYRKSKIKDSNLVRRYIPGPLCWTKAPNLDFPNEVSNAEREMTYEEGRKACDKVPACYGIRRKYVPGYKQGLDDGSKAPTHIFGKPENGKLCHDDNNDWVEYYKVKEIAEDDCPAGNLRNGRTGACGSVSQTQGNTSNECKPHFAKEGDNCVAKPLVFQALAKPWFAEGSWGGDLSCNDPNHVPVGICMGTSFQTCKETGDYKVKEIKCATTTNPYIPDLFSSSETIETTAPDFGHDLLCDKGIIVGFCTGGDNKDCKAGTVPSSIKCKTLNAQKFELNQPSCRTIGLVHDLADDLHKSLEGAEGEVLVGICHSGGHSDKTCKIKNDSHKFSRTATFCKVVPK